MLDNDSLYAHALTATEKFENNEKIIKKKFCFQQNYITTYFKDSRALDWDTEMAALEKERLLQKKKINEMMWHSRR